jgi:hypothetical protein
MYRGAVFVPVCLCPLAWRALLVVPLVVAVELEVQVQLVAVVWISSDQLGVLLVVPLVIAI